MNDTIYLHKGFLSPRFQRVFSLFIGIAHVGLGVCEFFWERDALLTVIFLVGSVYWFRSAYKYYQAGNKANSRIQVTKKGLLIKEAPSFNEDTKLFQWTHIRQIKIDHQDRQMTIELTNESPHVNRRYFFWLRSLSQNELRMLGELLQPYLIQHEISNPTITTT